MEAKVNPYSGINWGNCLKIPSLSHAHSRVWQYNEQPKADLQKYMDRASGAGIKHMAWSNYYASEPFYPLSDWFLTIPAGVIGSPNAEHHNFSGSGCQKLHINGIGSFYMSGSPHGIQPVGVDGASFNTIADKILSHLQYKDAGGITINHPIWSELDITQIIMMLKHDRRVLGIEIANSYYFSQDGELCPDLWDDVLITGQRAWGFCVPDHGVEYGQKFTGTNILLVDELTEYKCLKAYRTGAFYGKLFDSDLQFSDISYDGTSLTISAINAEKIQIVIDGIYTEIDGNTATATIPEGAVYCRAEAWKSCEWTNNAGVTSTVTDKIFSNPIMFVNSTYNEKTKYIEQIARLLD